MRGGVVDEETRRLYAANLFAAVRQLRYSTKTDHSLDLVLFLNGIPVFTAELKNPLTAQTVEHAIRQYLRARDPREPLFAPGTLPCPLRRGPRTRVREVKTIAAFLNTEGGDLLIGVADDRSVLGLDLDDFESEDRFMLHLSQVTRNALGDRAGTCIDPRMQVVQGKTVCVVTCQRSPAPVFVRTRETLEGDAGEFFVRSGPGTVKLSPADADRYIRNHFSSRAGSS